MLMRERDIRDIARRRHHVVHQRPRQELAVAIVGEALEQATTYALHGAADDLALDQHRVDDDATVMCHRIPLNFYSAGADIHLDDGRMEAGGAPKWLLPPVPSLPGGGRQ